ncbi:MAG TPA: response regulator transcription factor [Verrucomicrobiae bacterium]|jgi:DNA-binding NarL/FixJ family response regulator|nr:response regulator transcription factor [Verrucomicrobiae bacterium]
MLQSQQACLEPEVQMTPINVSIVEDDPGLREGLLRLLKQTREFRCLAHYPDAEIALKEIPQLKPDIVLMDINLPGMSGVECVQRLHAVEPALRIVMLTVYEDPDQIFKALTAGAVGYLLKQRPSADLLDAIRDAHQGGSPMSSQIARKVVQFFHSGKAAGGEAGELSTREQEVLNLLAKGYLVKEIADQLGISFVTTRTYIRRIYEKLHVHSRAQAVAKFMRQV